MDSRINTHTLVTIIVTYGIILLWIQVLLTQYLIVWRFHLHRILYLVFYSSCAIYILYVTRYFLLQIKLNKKRLWTGLFKRHLTILILQLEEIKILNLIFIFIIKIFLQLFFLWKQLFIEFIIITATWSSSQWYHKFHSF